VFFRVLLVGFSLFRPGAARAPLLANILHYKIFPLYTIIYISNSFRSGRKVGRIGWLKFRKLDFAVKLFKS
jgi:hypothetical protein